MTCDCPLHPKTVLEWRNDEPPQDRWVLVDLDDGACDCSDDPECRSVYLARYNPIHTPELDDCFEGGRAIYEWEVLIDDSFHHWTAGRIMGWADLPLTTPTTPSTNQGA